MLVIDAHAHPPRKGFAFIDDSRYIPPATETDLERTMVEDAERLIAVMQVNGIDKKVLLAFPSDLDPVFHYGETIHGLGIRTLSSHDWIEEVSRRYPERFIGFACLNPKRRGSIRQLERLVTQRGFRGVKLHPCHDRFEVDDRSVYSFYEKAAALGIPVAFHMGYDPASDLDRLRYANPLALDEVAIDLRELELIICHAGGNWYQEGTMVAARNTNVLVDISGLHDAAAITVYPEVDPTALLKRIVHILGPEKILFGTDNQESKMNPAFVARLGLDDDGLANIMGRNASRLLSLQDSRAADRR